MNRAELEKDMVYFGCDEEEIADMSDEELEQAVKECHLAAEWTTTTEWALVESHREYAAVCEERDGWKLAAEQLQAQVDSMRGILTEAVNHDEQVTFLNNKMYTDLQGWKKRCWAAEKELEELKASDAKAD